MPSWTQNPRESSASCDNNKPTSMGWALRSGSALAGGCSCCAGSRARYNVRQLVERCVMIDCRHGRSLGAWVVVWLIGSLTCVESLAGAGTRAAATSRPAPQPAALDGVRDEAPSLPTVSRTVVDDRTGEAIPEFTVHLRRSWFGSLLAASRWEVVYQGAVQLRAAGVVFQEGASAPGFGEGI